MQIELVSEEEKPKGRFQIEPVDVETAKPSLFERAKQFAFGAPKPEAAPMRQMTVPREEVPRQFQALYDLEQEEGKGEFATGPATPAPTRQMTAQPTGLAVAAPQPRQMGPRIKGVLERAAEKIPEDTKTRVALEAESSQISQLKKQIDAEGKAFQKDVGVLGDIKKKLDSTKVDNYSQESVDSYNALVNEHNQALQKIKEHPYLSHVDAYNQRIRGFQSKVDQFNKDILFNYPISDLAVSHGKPELTPSHPPTTKESLLTPTQRMAGPAVQTLADIGTVYGPLEVAANIFSQMYGIPLSLGAQVMGAPFGESKEWGEAVTKATVYEPRTEAGRRLNEAITYPLGKFHEAGERAADITREATGSPGLATAVGTTIAAIPYIPLRKAGRMAGRLAETGKARIIEPAIEAATRETVREVKPPRTVEISPEKIKDIFQTGEQISPEEMTFIKDLGLKGPDYRKAVKEGLSIEVPETTITTLRDRPYWEKVKGLFGVEPTEPVTKVETAGKPKRVTKPKEEPVAPAEEPTPKPKTPEDRYLAADKEFTDLRDKAIKGKALTPAEQKRYDELRIEVPYWMEKAGLAREVKPASELKAEAKKPVEEAKPVVPKPQIEPEGAKVKPVTEPLPKEEVSKEPLPVSEEVGKKAETEPEHLRPAIKHLDEVLIGKEGETHPDILQREMIRPTETHERGFVDPQGNFLTRSQAEEWVKKNDPDTYEKWVKENPESELHSEDYREAAGIEPPKEAKDVTVAGRGDRLPEGREVKEEEAVKAKPVKRPEIASKLRQSAESLTKQIEEKRHPAVAQQNVTARRARQTSSAYEEADRLENLQNKLNALADAHEAGTAPESLSQVTTKAQVETILSKKDFPKAYLHNAWIDDILKAVKGKPGTAQDAGILSRVKGRKDWGGDLYGDRELEAAEHLIKVAEKAGEKSIWAKDSIAEFKRIRATGIDTEEKFAKAKSDLNELGKKPVDRSKEQKIRTAEQALLGTKIPGYFPTPKATAEKLVEMADIQPSMSVLEPSAGKGNIADVIKEQVPDADLKTIEWQTSLSDILKMKGYDVIGNDFLEHQGQYDRIVMNPPFERFQDVDHVRHAYDQLKPGGKLVSIMSESPFFRSDKKAVEFREWLESVGGTSEKLPEKPFAEKSERATGVSGRIVTIDKPEVAPAVEKVEAGEKKAQALGLVHYKDQQRYFTASEPIERGKNKGKVRVTLTNGNVVIVEPDAIVREPSGGTPETKPTRKKKEVTDLLQWVRGKGGLDPESLAADVYELKQKESGFKGAASIVRKGGQPADTLAQEAIWEGIVPEGTGTDEFVQMIKDRVMGGKIKAPYKEEVLTDKRIKELEAEFYAKDPEYLHAETKEALTNLYDDEIMGFKEEAT